MTEPSLPQESLFLQALEMPSAQRAAFLARACGDNHALRAEVESLLRADARSGDLLDLPEPPAASKSVEETRGEAPGGGEDQSLVVGPLPPYQAPLSERPGSVIGPYKLLQQIGEGGMGAVFMAQ